MAGIDNLTPYQPGQSGNPAAKPKGARNRSTIIREAIEAIREGTEQSYLDAMTASIIKKAIEGDVPAYKELLDSAFGKNTDKQELSGLDGSAIKTSVTVSFIDSDTDTSGV